MKMTKYQYIQISVNTKTATALLVKDKIVKSDKYLQ